MARTKIGSNAQFVSTGSVNYIGEYLYIYGGEYSLSTANQTVMKFDTSKNYTIGKLFVSGGVIPGSSAGGITTWQVKLNGINIIWLKTETAQEDSPLNTKVKLLLPPNSVVEVITDSDATNTDIFTTTAFIGRIYNA